jgi:hypothetical protein
MHRAKYLQRNSRRRKARLMRRQAQRLPSVDPIDSAYRRLRYVRYADDVLLGFNGPHAEAEVIKQQIGTFLREQLHLAEYEEMRRTRIASNLRLNGTRFAIATTGAQPVRRGGGVDHPRRPDG